MIGQTAPPRDTLHAALSVACRAPSLHNSQPWRWQLAAHAVHLRADPARMLLATDPTGRQLVISCGAALKHARVAFAALGWHTVIRRLPDPTDPDHLASIEFEPSGPIRTGEALAAALLEATAAELATCTLTHLTEIEDSRAVLERAIASLGARPGHAQVVVRVGRVHSPLPGPRSPRRPRIDVLEQLPLPSAVGHVSY